MSMLPRANAFVPTQFGLCIKIASSVACLFFQEKTGRQKQLITTNSPPEPSDIVRPLLSQPDYQTSKTANLQAKPYAVTPLP